MGQYTTSKKNYSEDYAKHIKQGHSLEEIIVAYRKEGFKATIISLILLVPCVAYFFFFNHDFFTEHRFLMFLCLPVCGFGSFFTSIFFISGLFLALFPKARVLKDKKDYDDCVSGKRPWYTSETHYYDSGSSSPTNSPPHNVRLKCKVCSGSVWVEYGLGICPLCGMPNDWR